MYHFLLIFFSYNKKCQQSITLIKIIQKRPLVFYKGKQKAEADDSTPPNLFLQEVIMVVRKHSSRSVRLIQPKITIKTHKIEHEIIHVV